MRPSVLLFEHLLHPAVDFALVALARSLGLRTAAQVQVELAIGIDDPVRRCMDIELGAADIDGAVGLQFDHAVAMYNFEHHLQQVLKSFF